MVKLPAHSTRTGSFFVTSHKFMGKDKEFYREEREGHEEKQKRQAKAKDGTTKDFLPTNNSSNKANKDILDKA